MTMTGSAATSIVYEPDGMQVRFPVPFPVFHTDDVYALEVDGVRETRLTNFEIEGIGTEEGVHARFFTPPTYGNRLVLYRWTKRVQESDYPEGGRFPAKVVEADFDRLVGMAQEIDDQLEWTLKIPRGANVTPGDYAEGLHAAADEARKAADDALISAKESVAAARSAQEKVDAAATQARNAALMAESAAQSALEASNFVNRGMVNASEIYTGVARFATEQEHMDGAATLAATPNHVKSMIENMTPLATSKTPGIVRPDCATLVVGEGGVLSALIPAGGFTPTTRRVVTTTGTYTAPVTGWYKATVIGGGGGGGKGGANLATGGGTGGLQGGSTVFGSVTVSGGSGGGGGAGSGGGGGGGAAGAVAVGYLRFTAGQAVSVSVGAGGSGGNSSTGGVGGKGGGPHPGAGGTAHFQGGQGASPGGGHGESGVYTGNDGPGGGGGAGGTTGLGYGGGGGGGGGLRNHGGFGGRSSDGGAAGADGAGDGGDGGNGAVILEYREADDG